MKPFNTLIMILFLKLWDKNAIHTRRTSRIRILSKSIIGRWRKVFKSKKSLRSQHSGSADLGTTFRDNDGTVLIFESPYTGEIFDDQSPENMVVASKISENLKNDITINDIIGRTFGEF